ncbi:3'-5' exonuclease [Vibrio agarivorans]|uniref:3'-5' exonuclease n=1 Tax=Vibrio agarivorans TaxID=153622 RepID=A0ABT7Y717_9VIBR|nr:3'-5' exonuclease [Vibrio agarivorans]MDN2483853.1 3'-5' exonuclease [Vibrio agarivorans]
MSDVMAWYSQRISGFEEMNFEQRREAVKSKFDDKPHTKTTLKEVFRLKPASDEKSPYSYKNEFGTWVYCYTVAQCLPMRALSTKPRSQAQNDAAKKLVRLAKESSGEGKAVIAARNLRDSSTVIIDTETTGLDGKVIQIALVCSVSHEVLYKSFVATDEPIEQGAYAVHGISESMLEGAPSFDSVSRDISSILGSRNWTAYNTQFDYGALKRTKADQEGKQFCWIENNSGCVMYDIAAKYFGPTNKYGTISLANSLGCAGIVFEGRAHDSAVDCVATSRLVEFVASADL